MANSVDPDETLRSAASHLGLYCLPRPVCPNLYGKYGSSQALKCFKRIDRAAFYFYFSSWDILGYFGSFRRTKRGLRWGADGGAVLQKIFEMQVSSLKQHTLVVIYWFSLQVRIPYGCGLDHNLVKNNSQKSKKTPVSCIFEG